MAIDALQLQPQTAHEELRFESAQRAVQLYERAKLIRKIVIVAVFALVLARAAAPAILGPQGDPAWGLPAVGFICVTALLFTFAHVWSSRVHRDVCRDAYAEYIGSKRHFA